MGLWRVMLGLMFGFVRSSSGWKELGETVLRGPLRGVLGRVGFLVVGFFAVDFLAGVVDSAGLWLVMTMS